MAGFTPNEGENLIAKMLYRRDLTDREANLQLGLFTNASVSETTTLADITEPTGGGYARKALTDASWVVINDTGTYANQVFTAGVGGYSGQVRGYFIATIAAGGTPRLLHIEVDATGPYSMLEGATYNVGLSGVVA